MQKTELENEISKSFIFECQQWKVDKMFNYTVAKEADNKAFLNACAKIEKDLKPLKKEKLLIDVDGSLIQVYYTDNKKIKVLNDYEVDAVYIESEKELSNLFN